MRRKTELTWEQHDAIERRLSAMLKDLGQMLNEVGGACRVQSREFAAMYRAMMTVQSTRALLMTAADNEREKSDDV